MQSKSSSNFRSPWAVASLFALIAAAVYFVPYLVPVQQPTNSLSYLAGYSNRTAVVLLVLGALGFAFYTKGEIARVEEGESKLSLRVLLISLSSFALLCIGRRYISMHHFPGGEAQFFLIGSSFWLRVKSFTVRLISCTGHFFSTPDIFLQK